MDNSLSSICILERDNNGEVLFVWSHLILESSELAKVAISRSHLSNETIPQQFTFSKYKRNWIYIYTDANKGTSEELKRVTAFSICLFTTAFHPEKYGLLAKYLSNVYNKSGNPVDVLDVWLRVLRNAPVEGFDPESFTDIQAMLETPIKDLYNIFGEDIIHIWSAVMMKKRIIVYSEKLGLLLKLIRAFPLFAFHRQDWDILRPYVMLEELDIEDLMNSGVYIAGFTDSSIQRKTSLWDVFINVNEKKITINENVQDQFSLSPFHKDLIETFKKSEEEVPNKEIIKELTTKIKALLQKLEGLKETDEESGNKYISLESLQKRKMPYGFDRFLFGLSMAEGYAKI